MISTLSPYAFVPGLLLSLSVAYAENFSDSVPLIDPYPMEPVTLPSVAFQPLPVGNKNEAFLPAWISARVNGALREFRMQQQTVSVRESARGSATEVNVCTVNTNTNHSKSITNICVINGVVVNSQ